MSKDEQNRKENKKENKNRKDKNNEVFKKN